MANKMFLKLDGIAGESKAARHFGEIEITSWSWNEAKTLEATALGAPAGELAKNLKTDLSVTKARDKSSDALEAACWNGRQFKEAVVTTEQFSESGDLRRSLAFQMTNVLIVSFAVNGNGAESVSLNFEKIEMKYS
jgi:type VI secretion system secreted protein Hcp